jgi:hypothetical protein
MKQNKQMYEAPKMELIEMELQGILCASAPEPTPLPESFNGTGLNFVDKMGSWN